MQNVPEATVQGAGQQAILAGVPAASQGTVAPLIPNIVKGIYDAVSISIGVTFWVGIFASLLAAAVALLLHDRALVDMDVYPPRVTCHVRAADAFNRRWQLRID